MIIRDNWEVVNDHNNNSNQEDMPLIGDSEENIGPLVQGDVYVI